MQRQLSIFIFICLAILTGCKDHYTPKPHGYLRIDLPTDHQYCSTPEGLPFQLQYSKYAEWDTLKVSNKSRENTLWFNVYYPKYNARIHLSYIPIDHNLDSLVDESHRFVFEHTVRADGIEEAAFHYNEKNMHGIIFNLEGNTASNMEFLATDSTKHFLRGALYFMNTPNVDSLSPVINYIKEDIAYMVNNMEWTCQ